MLASRTDATCERQVEELGFADFVVGVGILDGEFFAEFAKFWATKVIKLEYLINFSIRRIEF